MEISVESPKCNFSNWLLFSLSVVPKSINNHLVAKLGHPKYLHVTTSSKVLNELGHLVLRSTLATFFVLRFSCVFPDRKQHPQNHSSTMFLYSISSLYGNSKPEEVLAAAIESSSSSKKNLSSPNAGVRSFSQDALSSYFAKNIRWTQSGFRLWRNFSANTFSPRISVFPTTWTFPGVADMDGPLTVRPTPDTLDTASL